MGRGFLLPKSPVIALMNMSTKRFIENAPSGTLIENAQSGNVLSALGGSKFRIKVIQWGKGSSAFYPKEVLERDGARAFPAGTKIYANHPTESESWDRPERDVTKVVGKTLSDATYEDGSLYAEVYFSEKFAGHVDEFKDVIGMSIYANGESEIGTIGEYTGPVLTSFAEAGNPNLHSIDVVTAAGAGGAILERLAESYKEVFSDNASTASVEDQDEPKGLTMEKDVEERFDALSTQIQGLLGSKQAEAQAEADKSAVESEVKSRVEAVKASLVAVETARADLLPAQFTALTESAYAGEDVTAAIETAKTIAKEAREAAKGETQETGRFSETASTVDYTVGAWK